MIYFLVVYIVSVPKPSVLVELADTVAPVQESRLDDLDFLCV